MRILAFIFISLCLFTSPVNAQSAGQKVAKELNRICIEETDGFGCIKFLKSTTREYAKVHMSQFKAGTQVQVRDKKFANNAQDFLNEFCANVLGTKTYELDTAEKRKAMILEVTQGINKCLIGIRATKEQDNTGKVKINDGMVFALHYYNQCFRGILDPEAKQTCQSLSQQVNQAKRPQ